MKITFVAFGYENLGIEYLSAFLKKKGHQTGLVFDPALFNTYHIRNKFLAGVFDRERQMVRKILDQGAPVVAFSVLSDNFSWACRIAEQLKSASKGTTVVFGGIHATSVPERVIARPYVDYVCVGEGEQALAELADVLDSGGDTTRIANIWAKKDGVVFRNDPRILVSDLNTLPLPDKDLFRSEYPGFTRDIYMAMTSRGCPYRCTYCYNDYLMELYAGKGTYLRRFSVDRVIRELALAKEKFGMRRIIFVDDVFTSDVRWLEEFAGEYKKKIAIPFGCLVHPLYVNQKVAAILKDCGCTAVGMGIQTVNQEIKQRVIRRFETNENVREAISWFKESGIIIYVDFIFGLPGESEKDALEAAVFLNRARPDGVSTLWLRYYPRAKIIGMAREQGLLDQAQVAEIEEGLSDKPASDFGNSRSNVDQKLVAFLLVAVNIPDSILRFFLRHRLYRLLPRGNFHHLHTLYKQLTNKLLRGRDGTLYSSVSWHMKYYRHYLFRRMAGRG